MAYVVVLLAVVAVVALWAMQKSAASRRVHHGDFDWLPPELWDARLVWSERTFRCEEPVPMVVRVDRAYQACDRELTLIEFKRRAAFRTHLSDVVELSAQRYVVQKAGHAVSRRGYVVVVVPGGRRSRALPVELEGAQSVERRVARLLALRERQLAPGGAVHAATCRGCGHQSVCPWRAG